MISNKHCRTKAGIHQWVYSYSGTKWCVFLYLIHRSHDDSTNPFSAWNHGAAHNIGEIFASDMILSNWKKRTQTNASFSFNDFPNVTIELQGFGDDRRWFETLQTKSFELTNGSHPGFIETQKWKNVRGLICCHTCTGRNAIVLKCY